MSVYPNYSTLLHTLYDQPAPVGHLGRGTHYSVFRTAEWRDVIMASLNKPQIHDFAVIWDEDHDERIIEAIEKIYMAGLLSPVQFIGERKGALSVILAARYYFQDSEMPVEQYKACIEEIMNSLDDYWPVQIGMFDRSPIEHQCDVIGIINDDDQKVLTYLKTIDNLWSLGTKDYRYQPYTLPVF